MSAESSPEGTAAPAATLAPVRPTVNLEGVHHGVSFRLLVAAGPTSRAWATEVATRVRDHLQLTVEPPAGLRAARRRQVRDLGRRLGLPSVAEDSPLLERCHRAEEALATLGRHGIGHALLDFGDLLVGRGSSDAAARGWRVSWPGGAEHISVDLHDEAIARGTGGALVLGTQTLASCLAAAGPAPASLVERGPRIGLLLEVPGGGTPRRSPGLGTRLAAPTPFPVP
jgi:hypothetical protein